MRYATDNIQTYDALTDDCACQSLYAVALYAPSAYMGHQTAKTDGTPMAAWNKAGPGHKNAVPQPMPKHDAPNNRSESTTVLVGTWNSDPHMGCNWH